MATSKAQQAWDALNERQQTYLEALYSEDQALEAERARGGALGHYSSTPARAWRISTSTACTRRLSIA